MPAPAASRNEIRDRAHSPYNADRKLLLDSFVLRLALSSRETTSASQVMHLSQPFPVLVDRTLALFSVNT